MNKTDLKLYAITDRQWLHGARLSAVSYTHLSDFQFSHEVYGEGFYMMEVSVRRLSDCMDYIPVMVSERLINVEGDYLRDSPAMKVQYISTIMIM